MELPVNIPQSYQIRTINLSYKLPPNWLGWEGKMTDDTKYILKNVSCEANSGELTAIAGPSGAGKTTLLEVLAGMIVPRRISGRVLINNLPMDVTYFRRVSGYVTQDEALFPLLTVEETLMYSARLRLHGGHETAKIRVAMLLKELGLDHIAGVRIGSESNRGVSGGEKRRVAIGVDLVHDPAVLLLDEPTSGLDSASALHVMTLLKSMSKNQGKNIVLTIHQPGFRILDLIDRVVLLSNGVSLHNGTLSQLEDRLQSEGHYIPRRVNVLEFAIDVIDSLQEDETEIEKSENEKECDHTIENSNHIIYCNSPIEEVLILSHRFFNNIIRTKQLFVARTAQALLAGVVLGTIFMNVFSNSKRLKLQDQLGFFAFTLTFLMSSTTEALPIFLQERIILMRETTRGAYRFSSYIIANTFIFLPFLLLVAVLYAIPVYWLVGMRHEVNGFIYFTLVVWMVVLMSNSFVVCFSALVPNFITGMSLIAGIMGSFFLFSGYFISKDTIPKYWKFMEHLSLFKYPFECFMINEFGGEQGKSRCLESIDGICAIYGEQFLEKQGLKESQKWSNLVMMLIFVIAYRFVAFLILRYRTYIGRS